MAIQARADLNQRTVVIERGKLIAQLKQNLQKHMEEYTEAVNGYQEELISEIEKIKGSVLSVIDKNIENALDKAHKFDKDNPQDFRSYITVVDQCVINLPVPQCYADEYKSAIALAEWDERENLELKYAEFVCFILDEWDWKNDFDSITRMYSKAK